MYRPPSIPSLQALEAAARLRSYSRAAVELGVTHGAISQRIRDIEQRLGATLFERRGNAMEPTAAASQILPVVRKALDLLTSVFPDPLNDGKQALRIGVLPSFAAHWLVPRLDDFHTTHPHVSVALDARLELSRIGPGGLDAAVRYGKGGWPGLTAERLVTDPLFPACSPAYQARMQITRPEDFQRCRLLRNSWQPWTPWFQMMGLDMAEPSDSLPYDDSGLMLDAVVAGHGIGLVRTVLAKDAIANGDLVRLSPVDLPFEGHYHYVYHVGTGPRMSAIHAFGKWLDAQLASEFPGLGQ